MIVANLSDYKHEQQVPMVCDQCGEHFTRFKKYIKKTNEKYGCDLCLSCICKITARNKPQCSKDYWDEEKKAKQAQRILNSVSHKESRKTIDVTGSKNGMYGKKHSEETRRKMSVARTGKLGERATAWKGGAASVVKRVKKALQERHNWFGRVFDRDSRTCQHCGKPGKDAHHIEPMVAIIARLTNDKTFPSDDEKVEWLLVQNEVLDDGLSNGVCLCRDCHKKAHAKWGSRINP